MRRFWRALKFAALGLAILAGIGLAWFAVANARATARLVKIVDELRAAGEPLSLEELARKPIPPESNAATYLRRAHHDVRAIELEFNPAENKATAAEQESFHQGRAGGPVYEAARTALAAYPHAVPLLRQAADSPDYDQQFDYNVSTTKFLDDILSDYVSDVRGAFRVLNYQAMLQLADGDREAALQTCLVMFHLARHLDRDPLMICYLVAIGMRGIAAEATNHVLRSGPLSVGAYDALDAELALHTFVEASQHSLRTERAFGAQRFREMSENEFVGYMKLPSGKNDRCDDLELLSELIRVAPLPYYDKERQARVDALTSRSGTLTQLIAPAAQALVAVTARAQALNRCLRILNALARREAAGNTDEPNLADLGLPPDITVDPFNGQPLHLKRLPDGWLIYSVGPNLKDDGGDIDQVEDVGIGPPYAEKTKAKDAADKAP